MELAVGQVLEGTVTGITKFGAFVSLEGGRSGLVHISEVANTFVNDVHDHVQIGQKVKVKVLSLGEAGKINLSIKRAAEAPRQNQPPRRRKMKKQSHRFFRTAAKNYSFILKHSRIFGKRLFNLF